MKHTFFIKILSVLFLATCLNTYTIEDTPENPFAKFNKIAEEINTSRLNFSYQGILKNPSKCDEFWKSLLTEIHKNCQSSQDKSCIREKLDEWFYYMSKFKNNLDFNDEKRRCYKETIQVIEDLKERIRAVEENKDNNNFSSF